jgi:glycosyltransferase involved in cell wall biosynthesis
MERSFYSESMSPCENSELATAFLEKSHEMAASSEAAVMKNRSSNSDAPLVMVIVPAYNEGRVLKATIELLLETGYTIVVVDDGSKDDTSVIRDLPVVYIRHPVNLGQGAALQTGMVYALRAGADVAVHFDADGQHDPGQINRLVAPILHGFADVVLGSRFLRRQDARMVPWQKRILLRGGIWVSWMMTGIRLSDAHNGFRALSRRALERIHIHENGFAHATEILQRIREGKLTYAEVPITVLYSEYSKQKGQRVWNSLNILFELLLSRMMR